MIGRSDLPPGIVPFHSWAAVKSTSLQPPLVPMARNPATLASPHPAPPGRQTTRGDLESQVA